jgi:hypothetical protein
MKEFFIDRVFGRQAFGINPGGYHAARPASKLASRNPIIRTLLAK